MDILNFETYAFTHLMNIAGSIALACFGFALARWIRKKCLKAFSKSKKNQALKLFITNSVYALVLIVVAIVVLGKLGVPTASLITILGTSSLAIGLALKDFLSNIAAGVILVFQKPFDIGELVELSGTLGTVESIDLFNVSLRTPSYDLVVIPNGKLIKEKMVNKSYRGIRRIELMISVAYDSDLKMAKNLIQNLLRKDSRALSEPEPQVIVSRLADSGIELAVRVWVKKEDFAGLQAYLLEQIKSSFDAHELQIPFPQLDVTIKQKMEV